MSQMSMFPPTVEALSLMAYRAEPYGWTMRIAVRLEGQRWTAAEWQQYERLTFAELLEIVDQVASKMGSAIV